MRDAGQHGGHRALAIMRASGPLVLLLLSIPLGLVIAVVAFFLAAHVTDALMGLSVASLATLALVTGILSSLGARGITTRPTVRRVLPLALMSVSLLLLSLGGAFLVLRPMEVEYVAMEPTADTRYWDLPTGSRIAYWHRPASGPARSSPVVFLHGGPGAPGSLSAGRAGEVLAEAGFDVYDYHQVGSGLSGRLQDVSLYTVDRHVDDLEAIRRELGAERMVLVGGSWGGTLASYYMARYPDRVERAVFPSPGALWRPGLAAQNDPIPESEGDAVDVVADAATLRFGITYYLLRVNPRAAHNLAPDEEMSGFFQPLLAQIIAGDVAPCGEGEESPLPEGWVPAGYGFYAMMVTNASLERSADPRGALRGVDVPILLLRGECDRLRREVHEEYVEVFPNAELLEVEGAAHSVSSSPRYQEFLLDFLGASDRLEAKADPPRDAVGPRLVTSQR